MIFKDYYKILGLETNKVSMDTIKIAYRKQAKKYHPDVNIGSSKNEEIFKDINEAYKILSTPSGKRKYDRMWNHYVGHKRNSSYEDSAKFGDFFKMFFGGTEETKTKNIEKSVACKGENVQTEVSVSIEDAFRGTEQRVGVRTIDGGLKKFKVSLPPGIQNNEKIRLVGERQARQKWRQKWRFINPHQN